MANYFLPSSDSSIASYKEGDPNHSQVLTKNLPPSLIALVFQTYHASNTACVNYIADTMISNGFDPLHEYSVVQCNI